MIWFRQIIVIDHSLPCIYRCCKTLDILGSFSPVYKALKPLQIEPLQEAIAGPIDSNGGVITNAFGDIPLVKSTRL